MQPTMQPTIAIIAILTALVLDGLFGEPPARLHPVVWMGRYLGGAGAWAAPRESRAGAGDWAAGRGAFARGALAWCGGAALVVGVACAVQAALLATVLAAVPAHGTGGVGGAVGAVAAGACLGVLLKPLLAWRMLWREVRAVDDALAVSLQEGRARLSYLCSRDVTALDAEAVRESAIESLAENLNDSVVAPLLWFALAGLPGAALYRFANTADAMWGYPGPRGGRDWQWAGKWAARADDLLSWLPARITAWLLVLAGGRLCRTRLRAEAARTPSPNSGWPMAAMAMSLGVRLRKPGVYALNEKARSPGRADTARAIRLGHCAVAGMAAATALVLVLAPAVGVGVGVGVGAP